MLLFGEELNPNRRRKSQSIFELTINGQQQDTDEDGPTDYTAGGDDEGAEETPPPADDNPEDNPTDAPEDYTVPDEGEGDNPPGDATATVANDPAPADAGTDAADAAPTDYTADTGDTGGDTGGDPAPADTGGEPAPAEGGDTGGDAPPAEGDTDMGGEGAPEDYTGGGGEGGDPGAAEGGEDAPAEGGGDPGAGGNPGAEGGDDTGGDMGGDTGGDTGGGGDDEVEDLEKDVFGDLTDQQMDIKNKELKTNFINLYDTISDIEERINDISKDAEMIKPLEFVSNKLADLAQQVSDYLSYTYPTKSYTENTVMYRLFLNVLNQINDILSTIRPEHT